MLCNVAVTVRTHKTQPPTLPPLTPTQRKQVLSAYSTANPQVVYYLTKLLGNDAVKSYITRHEPEILEHFELVVNTVSMEEAVQQQLEADGEFEQDPDSNDQPAAENMPLDSKNDNEAPESRDNAATE